MIKPLEGDRWGKQETTEQGGKRQLTWEKVEKVTEKGNEETEGKKRCWKRDKVRAREARKLGREE